MHTSIWTRLFNALSVAIGAGGVIGSDPKYQWIFWLLLYLSIGSAVVIVIWEICVRRAPRMFWPTILIVVSSAGLIVGIALAVSNWPYPAVHSSWDSVPITESNLSAYMRSSPLVQALDESIAKDAKVPVEAEGSMAFPAAESATLLGISDIAQLDLLLSENREAVVRMSHYSWPTKHVARGECVFYLFDILGAQLGEENFEQFRHLQTLVSGGIRNQIDAYQAITKNNPPKRIRVPLVKDFNLIDLLTAIRAVRDGISGTAIAATLESPAKTDEGLITIYASVFERNNVRIYGTKRGTNGPRKALNDLYFAILGRLALENGSIILRDPRTPNICYENLYALRPDVDALISKIRKTGKA
jgi:hypothetical protein